MSTRQLQGRAQGAAANDSRRTQAGVSRVGGVLKGSGISFTAGATIADTGNGLAIFPVGQKIRVRGSPLNSREFRVTASAAGSLTVAPAVVTTEGAGAAITLQVVE